MKILIASLLLLPLTGFPDPLSSGANAPILRLPTIFGDHMVLQAGTPDPIWGWVAPHTDVAIQYIDSKGTPLVRATAKADSDGHWQASLPSLAAGITGKLRVSTGAENKDIEDVLTGQTWLCGGQSNMAFNMSQLLDAQHEIEQAGDPQMRLFFVSPQPALTPHDDISHGRWVLCSPTTVPRFSAVAYYFGKHLRSSLGQPVGLIGSYWGGTTAQVWTSVEALRMVPSLRKYTAQYDNAARVYPAGDIQYQKDYTDFLPKLGLWNTEVSKNKDYQDAIAKWKNDVVTANREGKHGPRMPKAPSPQPTEPLESLGGGSGIPSLLYNGMIRPLAPYALKGVIWFQADGNMNYPSDYGVLIKTLITDWRNQWKTEVPFYYVEMNNMRDFPQKDPVQYNNLSLIREQQQTALELPKTGVVCSIDVGLPVPEAHFPNKKPVGDRLALLALNDLYNQKGLVNSPAYKDFQIEGNKMRIRFTNGDGLRLVPGHPFAGFAIKEAAGHWVWTQGRIEGETVVLWNDATPHPTAARYAWAANPLISIENSASLPLRPFRTDTESAQ